MDFERQPDGPRASEGPVAPQLEQVIAELLDADDGVDLDRLLTQSLVQTGLVTAVALWRQETAPQSDGAWIQRCSSGPIESLPPTATIYAVLTHGWDHDLGLGSALVQEGPWALSLGGLKDEDEETVDQLAAALALRLALDGPDDGEQSAPSLFGRDS